MERAQTRTASTSPGAPQPILLSARRDRAYGTHRNDTVFALLDSRSRREQCQHLHRNAASVRLMASASKCCVCSCCGRLSVFYPAVDGSKALVCGCRCSGAVAAQRINMMSEPDLVLRDQRLNGAIDGTGWPLVRQVQTCARGGSVTLMSQNVFHRRNRRRVSGF